MSIMSVWHFSVTHYLTRWLKATLGCPQSQKSIKCPGITSKNVPRAFYKWVKQPHPKNTTCVTHHIEKKNPHDWSFSPLTLIKALCMTVSKTKQRQSEISNTFSDNYFLSVMTEIELWCIPGSGRQRQQARCEQGSHLVGFLGKNAFEQCGLVRLKTQIINLI